MELDIIKVFVPATLAFFMGLLITPGLTYYLYKYKLWKKKSVALTIDGREAVISKAIHGDEIRQTPRMGGIVVWGSTLVTTLSIWFIAQVFKTKTALELDFLSRSQTWIPLFTLLSGALVGLADDLMDVSETVSRFTQAAGGLSFKKRLALIAAIGAACAVWFFFKLGVSTVALPFLGAVGLGWLFIPFFVLVMIAIYTGGIIDGIDGLSGGVFAIMFSAYSIIAFFQNQIDLSAFCAVIVGSVLAFLWFNIPPARFFLSETGSMALTITLVVVAFLADEVGEGHGLIVLPIIALPLIVTSLSSIIQLISKRFRNGKKIFKVAPLHHHFQAIGWPAHKVTMRYWIISIILALIGVIVALVG
jgi:phospho-N-acetylmuramoyl-pentapeptide-transferase